MPYKRTLPDRRVPWSGVPLYIILYDIYIVYCYSVKKRVERNETTISPGIAPSSKYIIDNAIRFLNISGQTGYYHEVEGKTMETSGLLLSSTNRVAVSNGRVSSLPLAIIYQRSLFDGQYSVYYIFYNTTTNVVFNALD